jgi:hypothetical protein
MPHSTPSDNSSMPHFQDQDEYSIPDDDLRSDSSSRIACDSTVSSTSMAEDTPEQTKKLVPSSSIEGVPHDEPNQQWTTHTTRRQQAAAKKPKTAKVIDVDDHYINQMRDTTYLKLRETSIEDMTEALTSHEMKNTSPSSDHHPSTININASDDDVLTGDTEDADIEDLTGVGTNRDPSATSLTSKRTYKLQYAHELRRGGLTDADKQSSQNLNTDGRLNSNGAPSDRTLSSPSKTQPKVTFSIPIPADKRQASPGPIDAVFNTTKLTRTQILPTNPPPETTPTTFYTYRAQLTFGLPQSADGVNVAKYFRRWIFSSCESIDHFTLVPYEDEKGQQITSLDQVPEDNMDFYSNYYHNHRVLTHGNLTGMVSFQCSTPWTRLKSPNHPFFNWLRLNKVFLNQTKFKTSSLVPCGFLLGAHPGHLRRDEAEAELRVSLGFDSDEELTFQLSSRSVSVPIQEGKPERFVFQAVVVETSTQNAASLREQFFSLGNPDKVQKDYPYTGRYQFVPFLKTKEWTVTKILSLAKLHVKIVQDLKTVFIANLQDIRNSITPDGTTLMEGFYGMQYQSPETDNNTTVPEPLLHSIHNTGKPTTKVALVTTGQYESAITQLSAIHSILTSYVPQENHDKVFINSLQVGITGQQVDSISSCNSAAYATALLNKFNPQDGEDFTETTPVKRFRHIPLTYAAAASVDTTSVTPTDNSKATVSSVTSADLDQLFEKMKQYIAGSTDTPGVNIEELEARFSQSAKEVQEVRDHLTNTVSNITARVETLSEEMKLQHAKISDDIQRQNVIILGMQKQFQESLSDFSSKLQDLYNNPGTTTSVSPSASTSDKRQWGTGTK